MQIESENCITFFFQLLRGHSPLRQTPLLFNGKKVDSSSGKSIRTGNVGVIDLIIANIVSLKKNEKVEGMDIIVNNIYISLEKNHGFAVKV